ncbi:unnamed protein product, partial [Vitis vinifera]
MEHAFLEIYQWPINQDLIQSLFLKFSAQQQDKRCRRQQVGFVCPPIIGCTAVLPFKPMEFGRVQLVMIRMPPIRMMLRIPPNPSHRIPNQRLRMLMLVSKVSLPLPA